MPNFQSAQPSRFISGLTQNMDFQPFGGLGTPDPFFYAMFDDDFLPYNAAGYNVQIGTGGSVATTGFAGGAITVTSGTTANNQTCLQNNIDSFAFQATNRMFYGCRISMSNVGNMGIVAGIVNNTASPFSGGITDGMYFTIPASSSTLSFLTVAGGVSTGSINLSSIFTPTATVQFDMAFVYNPYASVGGNVAVWVGNNLWGNKSGAQNTANLGPVGRIIFSTAITTANLRMTLASTTPSTTSYAMTADFHCAALER